MGAPQYEQAGADIAGSGTPGTIPVWSTGTTLGNSPLIVNGTNVGLGTASAAARFHIVTPDGSPYPFALAGTTKGLRIQTTASQVQIDGVDSTLVGSYQPLFLNGSTVTLATGGSARVTTDASGNVGIGTASPATRLHVDSSSSTFSAAIRGAGGTSFVAIGTTATGPSINGYTANFAGVTDLVLQPNGNNTLINPSSGNVGIGTASPGARLHVLDSVNAQHTIFSSTNASRGYTEYRYNTSASLGYFGTANGITTGGASADFAWRVETGGSLVMAIGTTERARVTTTGLDVSTSGYGLKLPATPGNPDTQTLDAYVESSTSATNLTTGITTTGGAITTSIVWTRVGRLTTICITITPAAGQSLTLANPWYVVGTGVPGIGAANSATSICTSLGAVRGNGYVYNSGSTPVFYAFSNGALAADEKVFVTVTLHS